MKITENGDLRFIIGKDVSDQVEKSKINTLETSKAIRSNMYNSLDELVKQLRKSESKQEKELYWETSVLLSHFAKEEIKILELFEKRVKEGKTQVLPVQKLVSYGFERPYMFNP